MPRKGVKSKGKLASALSRAQSDFAERAKQKRAAELAHEKELNKARGGNAKGNKAAAARARERQRKVIPFARGERVLLIGEGNFSFAHALVRAKPAIVTPHLLLATAYDSAEAVHAKYPDAAAHVEAIKQAGGQVLFDVDAVALDKHKALKGVQFDKIVFNFPHTGQGITDQARNVIANQSVLLGFFKSAAPLLRSGKSSAPGSSAAAASKGKRKRPNEDEDDVSGDDEAADDLSAKEDDESLAPVPPAPDVRGRILVTLRTGKPYDLWCLPQLATKGSLLAPSILGKAAKEPQPSYAIVRSFAFDPSWYEGYEHRRTIGFKAGLSSEKNDDLALTARERGLKKSGQEVSERVVEARTWEFELKTDSEARGGGSSNGKKDKKRRVDYDRDDD